VGFFIRTVICVGIGNIQCRMRNWGYSKVLYYEVGYKANKSAYVFHFRRLHFLCYDVTIAVVAVAARHNKQSLQVALVNYTVTINDQLYLRRLKGTLPFCLSLGMHERIRLLFQCNKSLLLQVQWLGSSSRRKRLHHYWK
jgi:hypothetical protein